MRGWLTRVEHGQYAKAPVRTIDQLEVEPVDAPFGASVPFSDEVRCYHVSIRSRAFMYHQVRYMVGALVKVGKGEWTEDDVRRLLDDEPRHRPFPPPQLLAPAHGLFLREIHYAS